jgi:hypothetical protein
MNEAITGLYAVLERAAAGLPRRILVSTVAASACAVLTGFGVQAQTPALTGVVHTVEGDVQGVTNGVSEFGIPRRAPVRERAGAHPRMSRTDADTGGHQFGKTWCAAGARHLHGAE